MAFSFATAKRQARSAVHKTLAVPALFRSKADPISAFTEITARLHNRLVRQGRLEGEGAEILEGVDQVVFDRRELNDNGIEPVHGDSVTFPDYQDITFYLDTRLPYDGPVEEIWMVTQQWPQ